jgi:hypothetical protein
MYVILLIPFFESKSDKTTTKLSEKRKYVVLRESGTKKSLISNQNITNVEYKLLL